MALGELLSKLFLQTGSTLGGSYSCKGYTEDIKWLDLYQRTIEKNRAELESNNIDPSADSYHQYLLTIYNQIKDCVSDPSNIILGSPHSNEPSLGLYIGMGMGIAGGIGGLVWYLKSKNKNKQATAR